MELDGRLFVATRANDYLQLRKSNAARRGQTNDEWITQSKKKVIFTFPYYSSSIFGFFG